MIDEMKPSNELLGIMSQTADASEQTIRQTIQQPMTQQTTQQTIQQPTTHQTDKPLTFSISRILGDADDKKSRDLSNDVDLLRVPKLHLATIHHYAPDADTSNYQHFESYVQPRACSTPEDEYPSPTVSVFHAPYQRTITRNDSFNQNLYPSIPRYADYQHFQKSRDLTDTRHVEPTSDLPLRHSVLLLEKCSDKSLDSLGESYQQSPSPFKSKKKKTRTVFSRSQVYQLESAFDMKRYLSSAERSGLAVSLNLSETQIKIWFQNRRNKWKRQINGEMDEIPIPPVFAAGYLHAPFVHSPSLNSYSHLIDSKDDLLRSGLSAPAFYTHPYTQDVRLRQSFIPIK